MLVERPNTIAEAVEALGSNPGATLLAGGTDVMVGVNLHHHRPDVVVSLGGVEGLRRLDGDFIGAGVTFQCLESSRHAALASLSRTVGSPEIRRVATIGGNLGTASPAGDSLPFLSAIDARVVLRSTRGERSVAVADFLVGPKRTARRLDELIVGVQLDPQPSLAEAFAKVGSRISMVISIVSCCVVRRPSGWAMSLGSVGPTVMRVPEAEAVLGNVSRADSAMLAEVERLVSDAVAPIDDHRATAEYRRKAAGVVARRCVERCMER